MHTIKLLDTPDFHRLSGYLDALNKYLNGIGGNLVFSFDMAGFDLGDTPFDATEIIYLNEPDMRQCKPHLSESTASDLLNSVNAVMDRTDPSSDNAPLLYHMHRSMFRGLWKHLKGCVDYEHCRIIEYGFSWEHVVRSMTFGFDYIIYDEIKRQCVLMGCGDMD
jgi:hypothetical protein